jgi:hypothetical protein
MEKNIVNPIAGLLLGILTVGTTTTVPGVEITALIPINVESIVIEKNPWLGNKTIIPSFMCFRRTMTPGPGWIKKDPTPSETPKPVLAGVV